MLKEKYSLQGEQLNTETGTQRGCGILIRKDVKKPQIIVNWTRL